MPPPSLHRVYSEHVDSCHLPDDDEHHIPTPRPSGEKKGTRKQVVDDDQSDELEWPDDLVTFTCKDDPENPRNWPYSRKVAVTMLYGLTTMCSTFASSVFTPATPYIARQYGISDEVAILGLCVFIAGYVPGPVLWAPISELYGRRVSVILPMFAFICFTAGTATATNLQTIFITRFFAGLMASAPVTTVGGGLADLFDQKERGSAVVFYSLAVVAGPTLGPVIGGAVSESSLGWRWTLYLTVILTSAIIFCGVFLLPETYAPVLLTKKAKRLRLETKRWALHSKQETQDYSMQGFLHVHLLRPLRMLATEPMVLCITLYNSFTYGILYMLFAAVPIVYTQQRHWSTLVGALPFIAVLVGTIIAAGVNITYSQRVFQPYVVKHGGRAPPERRLVPMMLGALTFPTGFFLLGWTSAPHVHWFPSVLGLVFIGMSFLLIFQAGMNYLIDAYTQYAASAVAANTFLRSIFAATLPFCAQPLFNSLGVPVGCSVLGGIGVLLAAVPFLFFAFGARLRAMSKIAHRDIS